MKRTLMLVLLVAAALTGGCDNAVNLQPTTQPASATLEELARTDPIALLRLSRDRYQGYVWDWQATTTLATEADGMDRPQVFDAMLKRQPYAVRMTWRSGATRYDRLLYAAEGGEPAGKVWLHPTGYAGGLFRAVQLSPDDEALGQWLPLRIDRCDFADLLNEQIDLLTRAQRRDHLETTYLGAVSHEGRPAVAMQFDLPRGQGYPAATTILLIDTQHVLPVRIHRADWQNRPIFDLSFRNLRLNTCATSDAFTPEAAGLVQESPPTVLHAGPSDAAITPAPPPPPPELAPTPAGEPGSGPAISPPVPVGE